MPFTPAALVNSSSSPAATTWVSSTRVPFTVTTASRGMLKTRSTFRCRRPAAPLLEVLPDLADGLARELEVELVDAVDDLGRVKSKPSTAEWLARGFRPSDEITRPSKAELDAAIAKASRIAASLGYRLSHWLVPTATPASGEEAQDAG